MAYCTLAPFGEDTVYIGQAITASTIANANRRKGTRPAKVDDYMPKFEKKAQTPEEMIQIAEMMTIGLGGQDLRQDADNG